MEKLVWNFIVSSTPLDSSLSGMFMMSHTYVILRISPYRIQNINYHLSYNDGLIVSL